MSTILKSMIRIAVVVLIIAGLLVLGLAWVLRQPNFGHLQYPGLNHADPAALERHVRFLASTDPPRNWQDPAGLQRAASYIASAFEQSGARCSEQPYKARKADMKNIIARFGPPEGALVVVGAHYDVFGRLPGADDNASGVAGLLELSRLLSKTKLSSPIELVAYSTEEPPFFGGEEMGSAVHADSLARAHSQVRAMIALEMIGYYSSSRSDNPLLLKLIYPARGNFISLAGRWEDRELVRRGKKCFRGATHVPAVSYSGPVMLGVDLSDHRNYWKAGFPAIMVCDTAYLRNPNYHEATDTPESLDYQCMAGVVDGVYSFTVHLAEP